MKRQLPILMGFILCCSSFGSTKDDSLTKGDSKINFIHIDKLSLTGDFDGDGKMDTIIENNISGLNKKQIDSFPDNQWDSLDNYFSKIDADVCLILKKRKSDTLHLGVGRGLFCLVNIGDNNKDKKDEIVFVVDYCNFTNVSNCYIYTLCDNKWIKLKSFLIHESAFENDGYDTKTKGIKGFLELRKNKWFYIDYYEWFNAKTEREMELKPLKIKNGC